MATILVVDDDEDIRVFVRTQLYQAGYDILVAEDAIVAGKLITDRAPDLLILDVNMPFMDGFEFAEALRSDPNIPYIPIIFLTVRDDGYERAMALGALGYVQKPITGQQLVRLVQRYLPSDKPPIMAGWSRDS